MSSFTSPIVFALAVILAGSAQANPSRCAAPPRANDEIKRTVDAFFDALRSDDAAAFERVTTSTFRSFDGGKRYSGPGLVDVVREAHARGLQLNWSIGSLDTTIRCDVAWSSWDNVGSAGTPPAVKPVRWLESAVLVRQNRNWKIDFFHSQRAAQE